MAGPTIAILFVVITFFSTLTGGLFTLRNKRLPVQYVFAFAAGSLLGVSFFDLMPEIIDILPQPGIPTVAVTGSTVIAFLFFHILDRSIVIHALRHGHSADGDTGAYDRALLTNAVVRAGGLSVHSFLDGVAIGAAFHIGLQLGLVVGLAVVFHDFSDGLNTVTVMLRAGSRKRAAFLWLLTDSATPTVGALATFLFTLSPAVLAVTLAFFVGEFLYIGAADLLPEAHQRGTSFKLVSSTILGVLLIFSVTRFLGL